MDLYMLGQQSPLYDLIRGQTPEVHSLIIVAVAPTRTRSQPTQDAATGPPSAFSTLVVGGRTVRQPQAK